MYDDICACSELHDRCFKKAEQARDSHFSAFIAVSILHCCINSTLLWKPCNYYFPIFIRDLLRSDAEPVHRIKRDNK